MNWNIFKRSIADVPLTTLLQQYEASSGVTINRDTAQALPAVYCAVNTIAESVASMPIHVFKRQANGEKERTANNVIERLLNYSPNGFQTAYDFKVQMMRSALLTGNAYARIFYDQSGKVQRLIPLLPQSVTVKELDNYRFGYHVTDKKQPYMLTQEEMWHLKINADDGICGKSPITVCRESLGVELASQTHGADFFKNSARPSGVLTMDQMLNKDQRSVIKDSLLQNFANVGKRGSTMLLEGGAKFQPLSMSNQDAEWLESRKFGIAEIARMFKISPIFLMDYSNSTYSNFSEATKAYLTQTLKPWLENIESSLLMKLVPERSVTTTTIQFETNDILRTTPRERYDIYDLAIKNGLMSPNECRARENLAPREGGDQFSQTWNGSSEQTTES
jgi:HK97 family phage portal protein